MSGEREPDAEDVKRGERLGLLRKAAGFKSQEEAANRASIERVRYNRMETGKDRFTSQETQEAVAEAFGVTSGVLLDYLRGHIELDEVLARRDGRWVERPERYHVLERFISHLEARKQDAAAIVVLRELAGDRKGDLTDEAEIATLWKSAQAESKRRDALFGLGASEPVTSPAPDVSNERLQALGKKGSGVEVVRAQGKRSRLADPRAVIPKAGSRR